MKHFVLILNTFLNASPRCAKAMVREMFSRRGATTALALLLLCVTVGCPEAEPKAKKKNKSTGTSESSSSGPDRSPLLRSIGETLNHLPDEVDLQLRPPEVIVAAVSSRDRKPVYAVVLDFPMNDRTKKSAGFNVFNVPARNGRFTLAKPGDKLRFFADRDPNDPVGKMIPLKKPLTVARVVDDNILYTEEGFAQEIREPYRVEIWRFSNDRVEGMGRRLEYYLRRGEPQRGWRPTPDENARKRLVDLLNQWARGAKPPEGWKIDPLVKTLPVELEKEVDPRELESNVYTSLDSFTIQEAVWLRDIARLVTHDANDDLEDAKALFDWTVRNIQLEESPSQESEPSPGKNAARPVAGRSLWEILLYGRGDAEDRAWVFINLCRHAGLTAVELGIETNSPEGAAKPDSEQTGEQTRLRPWLPALWSDGHFYLFDTKLGLPVPGPEGQGVATLSEMIADATLLEKLDLSELELYRVRPDDLSKVVALISCTPSSLSTRMQRLETALAGTQKVILTVRPSEIAKSMEKSKSVSGVRLWSFPFEAAIAKRTTEPEDRLEEVKGYLAFAYRPTLYKARTMGFQGQFDGAKGAKYYYRKSRPAESALRKSKKPPSEIENAREAKYLASYWLGLATFETEQPSATVNFLTKHTLEARPDGKYSHSAQYNLARAYEALDRPDEAIAIYEQDRSPQRHGNRLRARWLEEKQRLGEKQRLEEKQAASEKTDAPVEAKSDEAREENKSEEETKLEEEPKPEDKPKSENDSEATE